MSATTESEQRTGCLTCSHHKKTGERLTVKRGFMEIDAPVRACGVTEAQEWRAEQSLDEHGSPGLGASGCPAWSGRVWRPSNSDQGHAWESQWCRRCTAGEGCGIWARMFFLGPDDDEYPEEVRYDEFGRGVCDAFKAT